MQKIDSVSLEIEHLLVELSLCIHDLHSYRNQLSVYDAKQAELCLNKLEALISFSNQKNNLKLAVL